MVASDNNERQNDETMDRCYNGKMFINILAQTMHGIHIYLYTFIGPTCWSFQINLGQSSSTTEYLSSGCTFSRSGAPGLTPGRVTPCFGRCAAGMHHDSPAADHGWPNLGSHGMSLEPPLRCFCLAPWRLPLWQIQHGQSARLACTWLVQKVKLDMEMHSPFSAMSLTIELLWREGLMTVEYPQNMSTGCLQ